MLLDCDPGPFRHEARCVRVTEASALDAGSSERRPRRRTKRGGPAPRTISTTRPPDRRRRPKGTPVGALASEGTLDSEARPRFPSWLAGQHDSVFRERSCDALKERPPPLFAKAMPQRTQPRRLRIWEMPGSIRCRETGLQSRWCDNAGRTNIL